MEEHAHARSFHGMKGSYAKTLPLSDDLRRPSTATTALVPSRWDSTTDFCRTGKWRLILRWLEKQHVKRPRLSERQVFFLSIRRERLWSSTPCEIIFAHEVGDISRTKHENKAGNSYLSVCLSFLELIRRAGKQQRPEDTLFL